MKWNILNKKRYVIMYRLNLAENTVFVTGFSNQEILLNTDFNKIMFYGWHISNTIINNLINIYKIPKNRILVLTFSEDWNEYFKIKLFKYLKIYNLI